MRYYELFEVIETMKSKELTKIFFILISYLSFGQQTDSAQYSLLFKDCCTHEIKTYGTIYTDWFVTDSFGNKYTPKNNVVGLEKGRKYYLNNEGYGILNQVISITEPIKIDTVINSCIQPIYPNKVFTSNPIHLNCNDTINGVCVEYYPNGIIRLKGNFKDGRVIDSMNTYFSNGTLKSSTVFNHNDLISKSFHPNGELSYLYNSGRRNRFAFFKDGRVQSKRSNSKIKEFNRYSNGQLWYKIKDKKQISYYRNGEINQKLKRKPLYFIDRFKSNDKKRTLIYFWTIYDTTGTKVKEVNFYSESTLSLYSVFFFNSAKKFSSLSYFENGKIRASFISDYYNDENVSIPVKYSMFIYENGKFKFMKEILPNNYEEIVKEYEIKYNQATKLKLF